MSQDGLKWILVALVILGVTGYVSTRFPGEGAGARSAERLSEAQFSRIMQELQELRRLHQDAAPSRAERKPEEAARERTLRISLPERPMQGNPKARLVLMEFTDYQCPFCVRFHQETLPLIRKAFIETGRVGYMIMDLPLSNIHPHAAKAAEAVHCAGEQGKFFELSDYMFNNSARLNDRFIEQSASAVGLNQELFSKCLRDRRHQQTVKRSLEMAEELGFTSTPTFALGRLENGSLVDGGYFLGAQPYSVFQQILQKMEAQ